MPPNCVTVVTGTGVAAIAVVRLTGPGVDAFLAQHFSRSVGPGRCVHGFITDGQQIIDDAIAVRKEDMLDLNVHGGTWVVQSVLRVAQTAGFRISDERAVDGKTEIWREVLKAIPLAKTEQAVRMLLAQPAAWETAGDLQTILKDRSGYWMLATPRVAIVGPANVGKSTLANQLFAQARSITADVPGTTRDWVGEIANIDGLAVMLVDTPGQRPTDDPIEQAAIAASADQIQSADLVIVVLDQSIDLDCTFPVRYPDAIFVANKSDSSHRWQPEKINAIATVAINGTGLDQVRREIRRRFECEPMVIDQARWFTYEQRIEIAKNSNLSQRDLLS